MIYSYLVHYNGRAERERERLSPPSAPAKLRGLPFFIFFRQDCHVKLPDRSIDLPSSPILIFSASSLLLSTWLSSSYYTPYLVRLLVWSFTHLEILRPCPPFFPLFSNSHQHVDVHAFFPIIILDGDLLAALALNTFSIVCFFS